MNTNNVPRIDNFDDFLNGTSRGMSRGVYIDDIGERVTKILECRISFHLRRVFIVSIPCRIYQKYVRRGQSLTQCPHKIQLRCPRYQDKAGISHFSYTLVLLSYILRMKLEQSTGRTRFAMRKNAHCSTEHSARNIQILMRLCRGILDGGQSFDVCSRSQYHDILIRTHCMSHTLGHFTLLNTFIATFEGSALGDKHIDVGGILFER